MASEKPRSNEKPQDGEKPRAAAHPWLATTGGLVAGALLCNLLWGSAVPGVRSGYTILHIDGSEPGSLLLFAGVRFFIAGIMVLAVEALGHRRFRVPSHRELVLASKLSGWQTVGQYLFYYLGLAAATGVSASLIQGCEVFVALMVGALLFHEERLTAPKVLGSIVGLGGLVAFEWGGAMGFSLSGEGLLFLGTICASVSSVLIGRYGREADPVRLSGLQFAMGGVVLAVVGACLGGSLVIQDWQGVAIIAYLAAVSAVAYSLWSLLLSCHEVSQVVAFGFTLPLFGVLLSLWLLGDEGHPLQATAILGIALVCLGIWLVNRRSRKA